jgi:hypothetical protein
LRAKYGGLPLRISAGGLMKTAQLALMMHNAMNGLTPPFSGWVSDRTEVLIRPR